MHFHDKTINWLVLTHLFILCLSNVLVLYPLTFFGFRTTWGAFIYPLIFILTDLSTRLQGQKQARKVILMTMFPGLIGSYFISTYSANGNWLVFNPLAFRVALASFSAYLGGQFLDITIFQKFRQSKPWWLAPGISNVFGNFFDTYLFFFIAFYQSSNVFLSAHWLEIATVDLVFKLSLSLLTFVPLYGLVLKWLSAKRAALVETFP